MNNGEGCEPAENELSEFTRKVREGARNSYEDDSIEVDAPEVACNSSRSSKDNRNAKMWAIYGNTFSPCEKSIETLPPGQYTIDHSSERGLFFVSQDINLDDLMHLPDSASEEVIAEIKLFWTKEQHFRDFGFLWKRGVMLWGPPGSGKTSTVQLLSKLIVDAGGIAIYVQNPMTGAMGLQLLRRIEPVRPIVVIIEDIDAVASRYGEPDMLALLDGELQIDNVVFIATTNYPERLDKRLTNRPSRFDIVKKIGMPSWDAREMYLKEKNPRLEHPGRAKELSHWLEDTEGFSLAHIKELIISVEVFEVDRREAVKRLQAMMDVEISSDDLYEKQGAGFLSK